MSIMRIETYTNNINLWMIYHIMITNTIRNKKKKCGGGKTKIVS